MIVLLFGPPEEIEKRLEQMKTSQKNRKPGIARNYKTTKTIKVKLVN
jgi:hypothetical protein